MGHSAEYGLALWATAHNFLKRCGPQRGICLESDTNQIPCIHMHMAVYPCVRGCISTCMWPCIHVHVAVYPLARGCVSKWPCIHVRIWLCVMGHSSESGSVLNGPLRRISLSTVGHVAESFTTAQNHRKFIEKLATTFQGRVRQKVYIYIIHYPRPIPSILEILPSLEKKIDSALWATTQNDILIRISRRNLS
jgi:hypothetical protein